MQATGSNEKNEMAMHITKNHAALGFPCNSCGKILLSKLGCKVHIESEHIGKIFSCPHCEYSYKYKLNVKIHSNRHLGHQYGKWVQALKCTHEGLVFSCSLFEYKFKRKDKIDKTFNHLHTPEDSGHGMEITHFIKNALEANVPECLGGELVTCDQCNYTSKWNSAMRYHTQNALEAKVLEGRLKGNGQNNLRWKRMTLFLKLNLQKSENS